MIIYTCNILFYSPFRVYHKRKSWPSAKKTAVSTTLTIDIPEMNYSKIYLYYDCNRSTK